MVPPRSGPSRAGARWGPAGLQRQPHRPVRLRARGPRHDVGEAQPAHRRLGQGERALQPAVGAHQAQLRVEDRERKGGLEEGPLLQRFAPGRLGPRGDGAHHEPFGAPGTRGPAVGEHVQFHEPAVLVAQRDGAVPAGAAGQGAADRRAVGGEQRGGGPADHGRGVVAEQPPRAPSLQPVRMPCSSMVAVAVYCRLSLHRRSSRPCSAGSPDQHDPGWRGAPTQRGGHGGPGRPGPPRGTRDVRRQPSARACTRSSAPLNLSWSPTVGPEEVYCHIV